MEEGNDQCSKRWFTPREIMQRRMTAKKNPSKNDRKRVPLSDRTSENVRKAAKWTNPFSIITVQDVDGMILSTPCHKDLETSVTKLETDFEEDSDAKAGTNVRNISEENWSTCFPPDWSLKTRIRVMSQEALAWSSHMKTSQETDGICNFLQCTGNKTEDCQPAFKRCLFQWVYPALPWLQLFPRTQGDVKLQSTHALDPHCYTALQEEWRESFQSVYHLLRSDRCPFFYLCATHFTVLFRVKGMGGAVTIHALLTPSTKGLRDVLVKEGVHFSMPFITHSNNSMPVTAHLPTVVSSDVKNVGASSSTVVLSNSEIEDVDSHAPTDSDNVAPHDWLESMGLDAKAFPTLDPHQITLRKLKAWHIDDRPESMLLISGLPNVQALFNYLLNSKTLIPTVGAHTGIPPTILAPRAFEGASLKCLKAHYSIVQVAHDKQSKGQEMRRLHCVDISGPLLPTQLIQLCQLLESTQDGDYSITLTTHRPTVAFNCSILADQDSPITESDATRQGVKQEVLQLLAKKGNDRMDGLCMKEIFCKEHQYRWA